MIAPAYYEADAVLSRPDGILQLVFDIEQTRLQFRLEQLAAFPHYLKFAFKRGVADADRFSQQVGGWECHGTSHRSLDELVVDSLMAGRTRLRSHKVRP